MVGPRLCREFWDRDQEAATSFALPFQEVVEGTSFPHSLLRTSQVFVGLTWKLF